MDTAGTSNSRALIIGTSAYEDPALPALPAVRHSVEAMRSVLTDPALCEWAAADVRTLINAESPMALAERIADTAEAATGVLLIYFAGHGILSEHGELCLTVPAIRMTRAKTTGVPWGVVSEVLRSSPARVRIVVLDCCFSGRAAEALGVVDDRLLLADATEIAGTYTLTASARNRTAHTPTEDRFERATSFTQELTDLLRAGLPGGPAWLTPDVIFPVLDRRLAGRGLPRPCQRGTDTAPHYMLCRNVALQEVRPDIPAPELRTAPPAVVAEAKRSPVDLVLWGPAGCGKTVFVGALPFAVASFRPQWQMTGENEFSTERMLYLMKSLGSCRLLEGTPSPGLHSWIFTGGQRDSGGRSPLMLLRSLFGPPRPDRFAIKIMDVPGEMHSFGEQWLMVDFPSLHRRLLDVDGIAYFIDVLGNDTSPIDGLNATLAFMRQEAAAGDRLFGAYLPQQIAVCVSKLDDPEVFSLTHSGGWLEVGRDGQPRVPDRHAAKFVRWICRERGLSGLVDLIEQNFHPTRIRYYATSSLGFHQDAGTLVSNVREMGQTLNGPPRPVNVLEPLLGLATRVTATRRGR